MVAALLCTSGSAAEEDSAGSGARCGRYRLKLAGGHDNMVPEKRDGHEGYGENGINFLRVYPKKADILPVNRASGSLETKDLQCHLLKRIVIGDTEDLFM